MHLHSRLFRTKQSRISQDLSDQISAIHGEVKKLLISGLQKVSVRARPTTGLDFDWISAKEKELAGLLFKPTPEQLQQKIGIAVWPILAAHITN
jgi:two-component SAPR family response regulator